MAWTAESYLPRVGLRRLPRRIPLNEHRFQIGLATVVMLVVLRLSLGCHFLYEGVWKIAHRKEFTAKPFLADAKGPASPLFYAMLDDIDGRHRLRIDVDDRGQQVVRGEMYRAAWKNLQQQMFDRYRLDDDQKAEVEEIAKRHQKALDAYLAQNREAIVAYFTSLKDLDDDRAKGNHGAPHMQKRLWDRQQDLRKEVDAWLTALDQMGKVYENELMGVLKDDQQARGPILSAWNPLNWTRLEQINFAVTYSLTAIGLCLMLGFCTRLAALGGGAFMLFVVLTQPSWPTIYPPAPPVVGHALIVNKDFVEMVALFLLATTAAGRWGGLDVFLYHWIGRPIENYFAERM
jgi:uncharacterized membrane protein YphA (DoxX/SURF4 family)